jgi:hypothetical protein
MSAWADRAGFDEVFLSEHHVTDDGYLPSPIVMAAGIATRTERARLRCRSCWYRAELTAWPVPVVAPCRSVSATCARAS